MELRLNDQVAVVVGGAQGIGRAISSSMAGAGAKVVVCDISPTLESTAAQLSEEHGEEVLGCYLDVTDEPAVRQAADAINEERGRIDHVVYAAGVGSGKFGFPFWNLQPSDWRRVLDVNLHGAVNVAHHFAPHLLRQPSGSLLFISSIAGQIGSQTDPPYSAAKAAIINFAQCAAKDLAPHNVRVNTICPGMVKTTLNRSVWQSWADRQPADQRLSYEDWAEEKIRAVTPLGRWQEPEDVGAMALFLASEGGKNITGQTLNVDGGQVMH